MGRENLSRSGFHDSCLLSVPQYHFFGSTLKLPADPLFSYIPPRSLHCNSQSHVYMRVVAASSKVAPAAEQVQAHEAEAQGESLQQIWVRAVGNHDSRSVMVSLKAPTGDTELNGLGFGRLYSPQVGTLDPEKSFAAQGISKGATLSLLPRLIIGGAGGNPEDKNQETLSTAQSSTAVRVLDIDAAGIPQSCANMPAESDLEVYVEQKKAANAENAPHVATQTTLTLTLTL